jgi:hypothetical protein
MLMKKWKICICVSFLVLALVITSIIVSNGIEEFVGISLENGDNGRNLSTEPEITQTLIKKEIYLERSGYCYNPDYPESGPSSEILTFDWEEITGGDVIVKQLVINSSFISEDDHYGSYSEDDTGDMFALNHVLYNKSTGEEEYRGGIGTFPGVCSASFHLQLKNITGGVGLLPFYQFEIEISNCGEYPLYWKLGIFSEPDPGNEWKLELTFSYLTYE